MKVWERWVFGLLTLVVSASGLTYFWMKYLLPSADPFAVVNHPWQTPMLAAHLIASPFLILIFGIILNSHVLKRLGLDRFQNRRSGLLSFGTFFVMTLSGYLLQVMTGEVVLRAIVVLHVASGIVFSTAYVVHLVISWRLARAYAARRLEPEAA
jgi:hypothetical protein